MSSRGTPARAAPAVGAGLRSNVHAAPRPHLGRHANVHPASRPRAHGWGGARAGAGRPARGPIASEPHELRPRLAARHPVHITARVRATKLAGTRAAVYRALERGVRVSLARDDFRIVHVGLLGDRVELVVEADGMLALARGMQGFQVSAAKTLNRLARRRGNVFPDRYRMRVLRTRIAVRAVVGRLPLARTSAWPQTWLLRIEVEHAAASRASSSRGRRRQRVRRWWRSRADETS